ncbi:MAG: LssY C-terminal domain-containing protein [Deltaproteobacteria bacterium]
MNVDLIKHILPSLEHLRGWSYWIAFFAGLLETTLGVGLILPGSTIVLLLGALSARGHLDRGDLVWSATLGAFIGDNINYFLGRKFGTGWLTKSFRFLSTGHLEKARKFFDAHGAKSVFLGRFIPSGKELIPFIAGSVGMNRKTFLFWNFLGAAGWGVEYVFGGYIFAQSLNLAEQWLSRAGLFLAFLLISGGILYLCKWLIFNHGRQFLLLASSLARSVSESVATNEYVQPWMRKHRRSIAFLKARFDTAAFKGLPLTLLIAAFVYVLALLGGVIEDLLNSDPIIAADIRMANLFYVFRSTDLTRVFTWITLLGKSQIVVVFILISVALLWIWRQRYGILPLFIAATGSETFTWLGKLLFHRPRPAMAVYAEHSFSFPSGHATIAVAFYGFVAYLLVRLSQSWKSAVNIFFATLLLVLAIGFSRIYLGEHYLSDVWSGYLVGAMWLIIAISLSEWLKHKEGKKRTTSHTGRTRAISTGLICLAGLFYLAFSLNYHPPLAPVPLRKIVTVSHCTDIFTREQLKFTETLIGDRQEPLNYIFLAGNDARLNRALRQSGWSLTDRPTISALIKGLKALIEQKPHPSAPISPSFWNARIQDASFAEVTGSNWLTDARHLRIWRTNFKMKNGKRIYVGMVNATDGLKWGFIPRISPDLDGARELLYRDLTHAGVIESHSRVQLTQPLVGNNFLGDRFFSDGNAAPSIMTS